MAFLSRTDRFLGDKILLLTFVCLALGIVFDKFFSVLVPITPALFAFMTFSNTLGSGFRQMGEVFLHPIPILTVLVLLHVVMPVLCLWLCDLIFPSQPLFITGLVLNFAIPTGVVSLMWVTLGRGNLPLCLGIVMLDTLLSPLVVPLTLKLLVGSIVQMDMLGMMRNLLYMVALPALAALGLHQVRGGRPAVALKRVFSPFAKMVLLIIVISNATGTAPFLKNLTFLLMEVIAVLIFLNILGYYLGYLLSTHLLKTDFPTCQTITLTSGLRNISAGAVLAAQYFPADVMFPVAFAPVFTQLMLASIVKLLRKTKAGRADQAAYEASLAEADGEN